MTAQAPGRKPDPAASGGEDAWDMDERPFPTTRGVLSAAEIEALLRPDLDDMDEAPAPEAVTPKALNRFEDTGLDAAEEARRLTGALSLALREHCGLDAVVQPGAARVSTFASAVDAARNDGVAVCFGPSGGGVSAMLLLRASLASALIQSTCGGAAGQTLPARSLSVMDASILRAVLTPAAGAFGADAVIHRVEPRADYATAFSPAGLAQAVTLDVMLGGARFEGALIVSEPDARAAPAEARGAMTAVLTARLASLSVPVSKISRLKPGDTLLLGLKPDHPVSLLSGGRDGLLAAEGDIGRKGAKMAVRVTRKGPALRG